MGLHPTPDQEGINSNSLLPLFNKSPCRPNGVENPLCSLSNLLSLPKDGLYIHVKRPVRQSLPLAHKRENHRFSFAPAPAKASSASDRQDAWMLWSARMHANDHGKTHAICLFALRQLRGGGGELLSRLCYLQVMQSKLSNAYNHF